MEILGWLLDIYANREDGLVLWLIGEDGKRYRLHQAFSVTFYAAGPAPRLRVLWQFLRDQPQPVLLARTERRELFHSQPIPLLAARVLNAADQPSLFKAASKAFPDLTYYDADIPLALRYHAVYHTFPLAYCRVRVDAKNQIQHIEPLNSPWDIDSVYPPLRILTISPEHDPSHAPPQSLKIHYEHNEYELPLKPTRSLLIGLAALLRRYDPDLILSAWGDTWLLPYLLEYSRALNIPLPLNREAKRSIDQRPDRTYFAYGQVIYRGRQIRLFGRGHIDVCNAVLFGDYGLDGVLEMARVTGLPLQGAARLSPGTGISSMQMITALQDQILVPWHKQQAERPKTALDLIQSDRGGLVYQPLIGLHKNVAEIDFISMYPSIMVHFNISPETVGEHLPNAQPVPALNLFVDQQNYGLVPRTLEPLLNKRINLKTHLASLPRWDPRRKRYKAWASAHKWLLVTCFGYLGYKNARFGRIESHESVTAYGREALLIAKEVAEDMGFTVLHMYVDGMWIKKEGASHADDFQPVLDTIIERTGLPIALDGIYRWIAFLSSRLDKRVPVANRYFGVFQDGSLKMRGIETRRKDTPPFIAQTQRTMLERLAKVQDANQLSQALPELVHILRQCLADLRAYRIPIKQMLVSQKLSRTIEEYRTPSPAARAAAQLQAIGKITKPGQRVRFVYTRGKPGVYAWDLPTPPEPAILDIERYTTLLLRASSTVFQPFGVDEESLRDWVIANAGYAAPPGILSGGKSRAPLWTASLSV